MFTKVLATPATPNACSALPSRNTKRPECHGESDDGGDDGDVVMMVSLMMVSPMMVVMMVSPMMLVMMVSLMMVVMMVSLMMAVMMKMWWWMMSLRWPWPSYIESRRQIEMQ